MVPPPVVKAPAFSNRMIRATNRSMEQLRRSMLLCTPKNWQFRVLLHKERENLVAECLVCIKALFQEWIAIHVIAVLFPEARDIVVCELQSTHPLY